MPLCALLMILVSACGGGGGGGSGSNTAAPSDPPPTPAPTPPVTAPEPVYSLTGSISASSSQAADSDNNDPGRTAISNDTFSTAQAIPNPITLGGYINQPGSGAAGRSQISGDIDDYFRVELLAGQRITMIVADFQQADADLYLLDEQGNSVDFSIDTGEIESLVVPETGTYIVNAFAFSGATNYTLAIGANSANSASSARRYLNIVPWQSVVRYREDANGTEDPPAPGALNRLALEHRAGGRGRSRLLALRRVAARAVERRQRLGTAAAKADYFSDDQLRARWETLLTIKQLRGDPDLLYAEPNYRLRSLATPDDSLYPVQWHYPLINLPAAWDTTTGDPTVVVAVVDTGILGGHPDLTGQVVDGYDFVSDPANAADGDGIDPNPEDPGQGAGAGASVFHGSHVSGTVAASGNNGLGVAGIAYSTGLMALRALGADGSGTSYDVNQAVRYAAGLSNDSGRRPSRRAAIINLSLGGPLASATSRDLFQQVADAGVLVVAAAGNEASATPLYPAAYEPVIAVSAIDLQRRLAPYSNTGSHIDIAAPGGNNSQDLNGDGYPDGVLSTGGNRTSSGTSFEYSFLSGTSMAAPHVAGVLALMISVNPELTPRDIEALLSLGELTDDLGAPGRDDQYGHGLINAQRAVLAALSAGGSNPADNPRLIASSSILNFATGTSALDLSLENGGKGELVLENIETSVPWLQLVASDVDASGLGTYSVKVRRETLDPGVYETNIIAISSVNSLSIRVLVSVGGDGAVADVGVVYVLLVDTNSGEPAGQSVSAANGGRYDYRFDGVNAGSYEIIAGSDADNDLLICDPGEACGALLTVDQPIVIEISNDQDELDFPIEYQVAIPDISDVTGAATVAAGARDLPKRDGRRIITRKQ